MAADGAADQFGAEANAISISLMNCRSEYCGTDDSAPQETSVVNPNGVTTTTDDNDEVSVNNDDEND